jgi:hypothetical protein
LRHSNNLILVLKRTKSIDNDNYDEKEEKKTEADSDSDPKKVNEINLYNYCKTLFLSPWVNEF